MPSRLRFFLAFYLSGFIFFIAARALFLIYQHTDASKLSGHDLFGTFSHGARMDLAMSTYLVLPLMILILLSLFIPFFRKPIIYQVYSCIILLPLLLIILADLELFRSWGFRIDATPLQYLTSPTEAIASVSHLPLVWIGLGFLAFYIFCCWMICRRLRKISFPPVKNPFVSAAILLAISLVLLIPARGGFQQTPLNQSSVYFSANNFANQAAINAPWNFINGVVETKSLVNPYPYLPDTRAVAIVDSLYKDGGGIRKLFRTDHPNVMIVIWESFTKKATELQVNGKEVTPGFNSLRKEGIYFSDVYASGDRTDKGIAAVLSGYPALNNFSVIRMPAKSAKLPTLSHFFKERGYYNAFFYGGEIEFANIKSYIVQSGYDAMTGKSDFRKKDWNSKWGAHDGVVAARVLEDLNKVPKPFFATWLTLSSHEPFEEPVPPAFEGTGADIKFMNSLHYTDEVLMQLVQSCKKQPWWQNTVMIIIADHGHAYLPPSTTIDNRKIPMLWLGGALDSTGWTYPDVCSQLDLAATLSGQFEKTRRFPFSKNLMDSATKPWAYFSYNDGFGMILPRGGFAFDNVGKRISQRIGFISDTDVQAGEAMQQRTYQDYLDK